jgi:hypothetical protein
MPELRPGMLARGLARLSEQGAARAREGLELLAEAVVEQARTNASNGSHAYGTPTPARPGEGPATISETLRDSVTHSDPLPNAAGWSLKVGPTVGRYPPYGGGRTPADRYGYYLETGLRNGDTYPWLKPAADTIAAGSALAVFSGAVNRGWGQLF